MCVGFIFYQVHFITVKEIFGVRWRATGLQYVESAVFIISALC